MKLPGLLYNGLSVWLKVFNYMKKSFTSFSFAVCAIQIVLLIGSLSIISAAEAQGLPDGRQLVDRYVELIGGREAALSRTFIRSTGSFQMPALGIAGELLAYQAQGKNAVTVDIPGLGQIRSGLDGEVGWSLDPIQGPRLMTGSELTQTREEASFASTIRDVSLVSSAETVEQTTMNDEDCWRVKLTWNSGRETFDYFSKETGLLVGTTSSQESPMGTIQVTILLDDYKVFDGFRIPTRMTQQMMGQEQVMVINHVEFPNYDESVFALPMEIRALLDR
jgi:hypothetical protein